METKRSWRAVNSDVFYHFKLNTVDAKETQRDSVGNVSSNSLPTAVISASFYSY